MKQFLGLLAFVWPTIILAGGHQPPAPLRGPGPPPGLAIDQYLYVLFGIALIMIVIYNKYSKRNIL